MIKYHRPLDRGFTLVEVIVSVLIIGLFLTIMFGIFVYGANTVAITRHYQQAIALCGQKVEQLKSDSYSDLTIGTTVDYSLAMDNDLTCTRTTAITSQTAGKVISVTVTWTQRALGGGSKQLSVNLETLRYQ